MKNEYKNLRQSAQQDVCWQFATKYPENTLADIHKCFTELNPTVEWNEDGSGEYFIWEVWKIRFEKLLEEKKKSKNTMTIIEAIQCAENGSLITNNFLKSINRFLKYTGNGLFYEYEIIKNKAEYKYEVSKFSMAHILSNSWEVLNRDYFKDTSNAEKGSFTLNTERWTESGMGETNDCMYDCIDCIDCLKSNISHKIIVEPGPPAKGNNHCLPGEPTTIRKCTGCGKFDGPWVKA